MKILSGQISPSTGSISKDPHERIGVLSQDQFAFDEVPVLDVVMMGHKQLWALREEREELYAKAELTEDEAIRLGDAEVEFAELDGYSAEALAGELLLGVVMEHLMLILEQL